ncbi:multidrug efflux SMR transporter [Metasolibacillus meyeri]|uniref:Multidrug efflux SMR transporter n=1 Tax=Metasolibacillus meyeri TaxID=1071052 RepID=A0AAW9NKW4_9BACL|nr:multidrug efflux SMR transporter [Metasolibacillus meyeri]MEC1177081.1 multidrug efflux SMR transporter [Metasolibacillus meyeri]
MAWIVLVLAGLCEMLGVFMIGRMYQKRNVASFIYMVVAFSMSFVLLAIAMKSLPMGTAYAIWTGIGAAGGAILGMIVFGESKDWRRIIFITMILGAAIGLKLM